MGLMGSPIYVDANVLIEAVEGPGDTLLADLGSLVANGTRIVTSDLTRAEVLTRPVRERSVEIIAIYEELLSGRDLIESLAVDRDVLRKSAEPRAWLGGKLPDSIHVATAVLAGCSVIVSSDRRLRIPAGLTRVATSDLAGFISS
jgi:predicted nucleic acid-binding protein